MVSLAYCNPDQVLVTTPAETGHTERLILCNENAISITITARSGHFLYRMCYAIHDQPW
jgi:hypothetical protein